MFKDLSKTINDWTNPTSAKERKAGKVHASSLTFFFYELFKWFVNFIYMVRNVLESIGFSWR